MLKRIKKKPILTFSTIFYILFLLSSICLIYSILRVSNIENTLRYMISALIGLIDIYFLFSLIKIIYKGKNFGIILLDIIFVVLFAGCSFITIKITHLYDSLSKIYKSDTVYSASLIGLSDNKIKIKDVKNMKIAIVNKDVNDDLFDVSNMIIDSYNLNDSNELIKFDTIAEVLKSLYDKESNLAILPSK